MNDGWSKGYTFGEWVATLRIEDDVGEKAPVEKGERFVSIRTDEGAEVIDVRRMVHTDGWLAHLRMDGGRIRWVTCSKNGIKGYRRKP